MSKGFYLFRVGRLLGVTLFVLGAGFGCTETTNEGEEVPAVEIPEEVPAAVVIPNVVIIVADDLGWADVGYHDSAIETPYIDGLVLEGIELDRFYASPLCGPTRKGLYTGRSPVSLGVIGNPLPKNDSQSVPLQEHLISQTFKAAGYQTWMIGKWHLGGSTDDGYLPNSRGFDHFYGFKGASVDSYSHTIPNGSEDDVDWQRNGVTLDEEGYSTDLLTDEIVNTLIPGRDPEKPFFLMVAFNAVHTPLLGPEDLVAKYATVFPDDEDRQTYAAMAERMDYNIGRILGALKEADVDESTLVFFMSDNGGNIGDGGASNSPLQGSKGQVYEGGVRVAAGVRWPGVLEAGSVSYQFVTVWDVLPTLAGAVGLEVQNDKEAYPLDGRNLWNELRGEAPPLLAREYLVVGTRGDIALFDQEWKLIKERDRPNADGAVTLFNIAESPYEDHDVAGENPDVVSAMSERITEITLDVADQL